MQSAPPRFECGAALGATRFLNSQSMTKNRLPLVVLPWPSLLQFNVSFIYSIHYRRWFILHFYYSSIACSKTISIRELTLLD
jgi:hypothetical protein